jgi:hypothetical protein
MSDMEEIMRMHVHQSQWIRLKIYDEHGIAVCMYHPDTEEAHKIFVMAFQVVEAVPLHRFCVRSMACTERKFRGKEKKIAKWYFRELCRYLKHGILVPVEQEQTPAETGLIVIRCRQVIPCPNSPIFTWSGGAVAPS